MDLRDYLDILRARWRLVVATTLLGVLAAGVASMLTTPMYQSTASVIVSASEDEQTLGSAYTGSLYAQQLVKSYVDVPTSTVVTQAVVDDLGLAMTPGALAGKISVNNPLDTTIIEISATDPSPERAQLLATATTEAFTARVEELQTLGQSGAPSLVSVDSLQSAALPTAPVSPRTKINLALGFLVGLAIGVGAAVLLETLDTRIKSVEMLQKYFEIPLLGVIGYDPDAAKQPLIAQADSHSTRAESFRQVRTNLQFVDVDHRPRSIVVTSSVPMEGKTTTAINLAITLAQTGQPVFLIEGDLRRPKVADYLGIEGGAGLTDALVGRATVDEVLQPWGTTGNLWVLAAGLLPPNPSELLGSQAMADLLHHLETRATLIIDAPPLLPVTDAAVVTRLAGGAIIVVAANKTRREHLRTAADAIDGVGGRILGLVFNMAPSKGPDAHRYGYGYGYGYTGSGRRAPDDHAPVVPAGLGGLPGVNGSSTPTMPSPSPSSSTSATASPSAATTASPATPTASSASSVASPKMSPSPTPSASAAASSSTAATTASSATPTPSALASASPTRTAAEAHAHRASAHAAKDGEATPVSINDRLRGVGTAAKPAPPTTTAEPAASAVGAAKAAGAVATTPAPAPVVKVSEPAPSGSAAASTASVATKAAPVVGGHTSVPRSTPAASGSVPAARTPDPPAPVAEPATNTVTAPLVRSTAVPPPPPAPAPMAEPAVSPFDSDTVLPGEPWTPPRPRPAFDPLTAPLDEVTREQ